MASYEFIQSLEVWDRELLLQPLWDGDLDIAPRPNPIDRIAHPSDALLDAWPTRGVDHDDADSAVTQILLVFQILVSCDQHIEASLLCL